MKSILIICDGMADRLVNGTTPLESAYKPHIDRLAREGICGIMDTVGMGVRPGSDTSHLSLFGYNPYEVYLGRGHIEAEGAGIKLEKGDVALRCNFSSVIDGKVVDRRAGREEYGLSELAKAIDGMEIELDCCTSGNNENNEIKIPGFYNDVDIVKVNEKESCLKLVPNESVFIKSLGLKALLLKPGNSFYLQTGLQPTIQVTGFKSGHIDDGYGATVPNLAEVKIDVQLVKSQQPEKIISGSV